MVAPRIECTALRNQVDPSVVRQTLGKPLSSVLGMLALNLQFFKLATLTGLHSSLACYMY